jgi:hypothetical protein
MTTDEFAICSYPRASAFIRGALISLNLSDFSVAAHALRVIVAREEVQIG